MRRIWAYMIDLLFITLVLNMVNNINFLNPKYDEYLEVEENYNTIVENIYNDKYDLDLQEIRDLSYDLNYYGLSFTITRIVIYSAYFIFFQYFNKGQTLGKKLMKVKVLNNDDTKISLGKLSLREIFLFGLYADILNIICLFILPKSFYLFGFMILDSFKSSLLLITSIFILLKKDQKGLHDMLFKTKVVLA